MGTKPLPSLCEAFSGVRCEVSRKRVMLGSSEPIVSPREGFAHVVRSTNTSGNNDQHQKEGRSCVIVVKGLATSKRLVGSCAVRLLTRNHHLTSHQKRKDGLILLLLMKIKPHREVLSAGSNLKSCKNYSHKPHSNKCIQKHAWLLKEILTHTQSCTTSIQTLDNRQCCIRPHDWRQLPIQQLYSLIRQFHCLHC